MKRRLIFWLIAQMVIIYLHQEMTILLKFGQQIKNYLKIKNFNILSTF
jgi:hypothetical protein